MHPHPDLPSPADATPAHRDTSADAVCTLEPGRTGYALGFLFDDAGRVALIRKNRPRWQAGLRNGIGGHIEPGETPREAMVREFEEETGGVGFDWDHVASLVFDAGQVWVFRGFTTVRELNALESRTDESVDLLPLAVLAARRTPMVENLSWLVPLCAYTHDRYAPVVAREVHGQSGPTDG